MTIYIAGEFGPFRGSCIREVSPDSSRDAPFFDADFFKCNGMWYKIGNNNSYVEESKDGRLVPHNFERKADDDESRGYENMLRKYLRDKAGDRGWYIA